MIHEEDLTKEQNEFIDALEECIDDADVRLQRVSIILAQEEIDDPRIFMPFD